MDPNATLKKIREVLEAFDRDLFDDGFATAAEDLAELVRNLDTWLSKGGFPPDEWGGADVKPGIRTALLEVFEKNDGVCLDNERERERLADAIVAKFDGTEAS